MSTTLFHLAMLNAETGMIVLLILVLLFGAKKLPELARGLGQSIKEFNKGKNGPDEPPPTEQPPQPPRQIP